MNTRLTIITFLSLCYTLGTFAAGWVSQSPILKCELFDEQESMIWSKDHIVNLSRAGITPLNYSSSDEAVKVEIKVEVLGKKLGNNDSYRLTEMKLSALNVSTKKENYGAGVKLSSGGLYEKLRLESADGSVKYQLNCFSR
jgi:hypothetical protein